MPRQIKSTDKVTPFETKDIEFRDFTIRFMNDDTTIIDLKIDIIYKRKEEKCKESTQ